MRELQGRDPAEVRTVFLMLFMFVFLNADVMLMVPSFRAIRDEFGKNEAAIGLVASLFVFSGAGIALVSGYLADRYPRKLLVFFTILLGEIPCLLTGYVRSFEELFLIRALTGLGIGGLMPLIYSMIGDLVTDKERATASSWIGLAEGVGLALGMAVAGNLVERTDVAFLGASGWRLPFVLAALPNFILAPLFLLLAKEPPRGGGERSIQKELAQGLEYKRRIKLRDYLTIFRNRTNLYFILQAVPGTIGWGVLPNWVVAYYQEKNVSAALATNLNLLIGLGMILGGFFGGILGDRLHRRNKKYSPILCGITTLLGLAFFLAMLHWPLPDHPAVADMAGPLAIGIVGGFLITVTSSNIRAIVLNVNPPENRGAMMSIFTLSDSIGKGLGPVLGGVLIVAVGYIWTMDLATLAWIPCALVFLFLLAPQYPKDAAHLDQLMAERAKEMEQSL
ncbi:MAG: hypothetical protein A2V67_14430 [Deltaproteobacteria bacterium RBG_13_61_14]|nr:MAG: hypothetical protein A2V67_14430 [Deltaproteobacteria bacterium RBG_13_61_14]